MVVVVKQVESQLATISQSSPLFKDLITNVLLARFAALTTVLVNMGLLTLAAVGPELNWPGGKGREPNILGRRRTTRLLHDPQSSKGRAGSLLQ
jgi:hypothetical protein